MSKTVVSTGRTSNPEDLAFSTLERERALRDSQPKPVTTPFCAGHDHHVRNCGRCRAALVRVIQSKTRQDASFKRLMNAPVRGR